MGLLAEIERRVRAASSTAYDPRAALSNVQAGVWNDPSRWIALPCGRQAGKTHLLEEMLLATARARRGEKAFYLSTTIKRAVRTIWDEIVLWNSERGLGGRPNQTHHTLTFPHGGQVIVTGVENKKMANDIRGQRPVALYVLDECQDWNPDLIRYFYDRVVYPGLVTVRGKVIVCGTGDAPRGWWYERTVDPSWSTHTWGTLDNPFLPEGEGQALIDKALKDRGVDITDPSIQREFFAKFVIDTARQIFPVDEKNLYDEAELPKGKWRYVVAADFGSVDATAVVVWGWVPESRHLWVVHAEALGGPGSGKPVGSSEQVELCRKIIAEYQKKGVVAAVVGDPAGGGAAVMQDLKRIHGLHMVAAQKDAKAAACITLRDGLRSGRAKLPKGDAVLTREIQEPEWDPDNVGKAVKGHFPDRIDALLYGYREAAAMHQFKEPVTDKRTPEQKIDDAVKAAEKRKTDALKRLGLR